MLVLLVALASGRASVAQPLPPLEEYQLRAYAHEDGLTSAYVHWLSVGADGYLYVPQERGVFRFDGQSFEQIPLPEVEGNLAGLREDAHGRLWLVTRGRHVGVLDDGRFHRVRALERGRLRTTGDGFVWAANQKELVRVHLDGVTPRVTRVPYPPGIAPDSVTILSDVHSGGRFGYRVAARHALFAHVAADSTVRFEPMPAACPQDGLVSTFADATGVWVAGEDGTCYVQPDHAARVDLDTLTLDGFAWPHDQSFLLPSDRWPGTMGGHVLAAARRAFGETALLRGQRIKRVLRARNRAGGASTYWVVLEDEADEAGTLVRLRAGTVREIELREILDFHQITYIVEDQEGSIWVGTDKGLVQVVPRRIHALVPGPYLAEGFTTAITQTRDGAVWVGTWGGGLHRYADGRLTHHYTTGEGLPSAMVRALHEAADGTLWVGTDLGVAALRDGHVRPVSLPSTVRQIRSFTEAPDGTLWIAEQSRLFRRTAEGALVEDAPGAWEREGIWVIHRARDGLLWVGTERGLYRLRGPQRQKFGEADGFGAQPYPVSIHEEDDGTLWIGTQRQGLYRYRPGNGGEEGHFTRLSTADGLHSDGIWSILPDGLGGFWLSSDQGIGYVRREALHTAADAIERGQPVPPLHVLVFTEAEGMPSRECNRAGRGAHRLADGRLVFNNLEGLAVVDPERTLRPPPPPPVVFRAARADGQPLALEGDDGTRLPKGTRHVTFDFAALSFAAPAQTRYRYRLDGYDEGWVDGGGESHATYTGLPPGRYTLQVQGASGQSAWSEKTATLAVTVPPLFWQQWWVRLLVLAGGVSLLAVAYRTRVRRLLEVERLRLRIASDLHDDVGSNLSSIALLSEMLQDEARLDDLGQRQLRRINAAAEETIGSLRDVIWLVDPAHDTLDDLVRRMRATAADLLNGTAYTFEAPTLVEPRTLRMDVLRHVFLLYKEALHNVAKHARATCVAIEVRDERGLFVLTIRDDGVGFREDEVRRGHGLASMRRRADQVSGRIEIESAPGNGTTLTFVVRIA